MKQEIWKDIEGYEGYYQISSFGMVKATSRIYIDSLNRRRFIKEKYLKISVIYSGYCCVLLNAKNKKSFSIHRLVAKAFIPNPLKLPQVNHKNGDKLNNTVANLEWVTASENIYHAHKIGLRNQKRGRNNAAKKVINIENGHVYGCVSDASESIGLKRETLVAMLTGRNRNKTALRYYNV